jgi:hypothetical protein
MKKIRIILLFVFLVFSFISCDETFEYAYTVKNLTPNEITIIYQTGNEINNYRKAININSKEHQSIYVSHAAGGKELLGQDISIVFSEFSVKNGDILSNIDYRDKKYWDYKEISSNNAEYILTVDSTHFK